MNIDLGYLGKVVLEEVQIASYEEGFTVVLSGYTESGIRVHGVVDTSFWLAYPRVWNNAIMIKVD
jgi:hypothetical protein